MKKPIKEMGKTKELFVKICESNFSKIKNNENMIFESLNFSFNWDNEYEKLKKSNKYFEILNENSDYNKMKKIENYFYGDIIYPITESVYLQAKDLPITSEILLENTYDEIFKKVKKNVEPELVEFFENYLLSLPKDKQMQLIEEFNMGEIGEMAKKIGNGISSGISYGANFMKKLAFDLATIASGFWFIMKTILHIPNLIPGMSEFLNQLFSFNDVNKTIIKKEIDLLKVNRPELEDYLNNELQLDLKDILKDCWKKNLNVIDVNSRLFNNSHSMFYQFYIFSKKLFYNTTLRPYNLEVDFNNKMFLKELKVNEKFNKMISKYRLCTFTNIIELITYNIYAAFEIGHVEDRLVKKVESIRNQRNVTQVLKTYKEFFDIKPNNNADRIFINAASNLIYLKEMFLKVKIDIEKIAFWDSLIKKDIEILLKTVDQALQEIMDARRKSQEQPETKKYEESYRDNKEKKLLGNEPTQPKKISVFDL